MTTTTNAPATENTATIELELSPAWISSLEAYAAHQGVTVESIIQNALAEYVTRVKVEVDMPQGLIDAATRKAKSLGISLNTYVNRLVHSSLAA